MIEFTPEEIDLIVLSVCEHCKDSLEKFEKTKMSIQFFPEIAISENESVKSYLEQIQIGNAIVNKITYFCGSEEAKQSLAEHNEGNMETINRLRNELHGLIAELDNETSGRK